MSEGQQEQDESGGGGGTDPRLEVMEQYTLKTMKIKSDKWSKVNKISHLMHNYSVAHIPSIYTFTKNVDAKSGRQCNITK